MKRSGFTMIELIFVIVILGILAAVAIPKLAATRDDAKISSMATAIQTAKSEIMAQVVASGKIPQAAANDTIDGTDATRGLDDFSNVISEMFELPATNANSEIIVSAAANGGQAITFRTETAAGGTPTNCVTYEINATDLEVRHEAAGAVAGTSPVCVAIQSMVEESVIPVRGSRVTY